MSKKSSSTGGDVLSLFDNDSKEQEKAVPKSQVVQKKRNNPHRSSYPKKDNSANKRLWMMLYGEPKRKLTPDKQETARKDGALFK